MHKYTNEKEILEALERQALLVEQKLNKQAITLNELNEELPGSACVSKHDLVTFKVVYVSEKALRISDTSREEVTNSPVKYANKITFPGDLYKGISVVKRHLASHHKQRAVGYLQRFKMLSTEYNPWYTVTKADTRRNELISTYIPINELYSLNSRMLRILEEEIFFKENYQRFVGLTDREKEIITLLANGLQNNEIGDVLFISKATVEQHRKNLKRKLEIKRFVDLIRFAQAFDLI